MAVLVFQNGTEKDEIRQSADMESIRKCFEEGKAFQKDEDGSKEKGLNEDLEIKFAGKARERFKKIDQEAPKNAATEPKSSKDASKWTSEVNQLLVSIGCKPYVQCSFFRRALCLSLSIGECMMTMRTVVMIQKNMK